MKKVLSTLLAITMLSSFYSCSDSTAQDSEVTEIKDDIITDSITTYSITTEPIETNPPDNVEESEQGLIINYELTTLSEPISLPLDNENIIHYLSSDVEEGYYFMASYITNQNDIRQTTIHLVDEKANKIIKQANFDDIIKQRWPDAHNINLSIGVIDFDIPGKYENGVIKHSADFKLKEDSIFIHNLKEIYNHEPMQPFKSNSSDWSVEINAEYDKLISATVKGINGSSFTYLAEEWGFDKYSDISIERQLIVHPTLNCALLMCEDEITIYDSHYPPRTKALLISLEDGKVLDGKSCYTRYSTIDVEYPVDLLEFYRTINADAEDSLTGKIEYIYAPYVISTENGFEVQISITDYKTGEEIFPAYHKFLFDFYARPDLPKKASTALIIDGVEYIFPYGTGDSESASLASKFSFTEPIEIMFDEQKITVEPPIFTGIPVDLCYSYKDFFPCIDGSIIFTLSDGKSIYVQIDKSGNILNVSRDYADISDGRSKSKYLDSEDNKLRDELVDKYEYISYFYDGLALIANDYKIGIIDKNGNELLSPCIEYDTVLYPPKAKELYIVFMFEDAFVLPIGGEFAIINITREN